MDFATITNPPCVFAPLLVGPVHSPTPRAQVQVWDWDRFGPDALIGSTFIDLEDRWFSGRWQALDPAKRPVEARPLWAPTSLFPQGTLSMLVEIMTPGEAHMAPVWPVERPLPQDWECRVVVWKTRHVPANDFGGIRSAPLMPAFAAMCAAFSRVCLRRNNPKIPLFFLRFGLTRGLM